MPSTNKRKRSNLRVKKYRAKKARTKAPMKKKMMKRKMNRRYKKVRVLTPSDMQLFRFRIPGPKRAMTASWEGRLSYTDTHAETFFGQTGVQAVFYGKMVGTKAQVEGAPNIVKNSRTNTTAPYFTLDPNRTTTGSLETSPTVPTGQFPVVATPTNQSIYWRSQKSSVSLTNFASIACHCEVRWVIYKQNSGQDPITIWEQDMVGLRGGQVAASIPGGVLTAPVTGYPVPEFYGEDPENNMYWKKYCKILKKSEFILPAGTTIRFEFSRVVNKLLKESEINSSGFQFLKGITFCPVFIFKPSPVDAYLSSDGAATRQVNTGTCKIGYMQTDTLYFNFLKEKSTPANVVFTANIKNTFANMNQAHIDDDDDVQAVVEA